MLSCTALVNACIIVCLRKAALSYPKPPLGRPRQSASGIATYEGAWAVRAQARNACSWDCNSHVGVCAWSARVPPGTAEPHPGESARGAAACVLAGASAEPSGRLTRGCALVATPFAVRGWTLQWDFRDLPNPAVWPAHRTGPCFNAPPRPPGLAPPAGLEDRNIRTGRLWVMNTRTGNCNSHAGVCAWSARATPGPA